MVTFSKFLENYAVGKTNSIAGSGPSAAKIGVLQLRDTDGTVIGTYNYVNGGYGRGYIPAGNYMVLPNLKVRPDQFDAMSIDGVAYKFPVAMSSGSTEIPDSRVDHVPTQDNPQGGPRDYIMIHPDGGSRGTMGCIGIQGDGSVQKDFFEKLKYLINKNNGSYPLKFDTAESSIGPTQDTDEPPQQPSSETPDTTEPTERPQQASVDSSNTQIAQALTPKEKEEQTPSNVEVSKQADEIANTIKDWDWNASKPSPQTGKFYPSEKQFSDGSTRKTLSDMMTDNLRVKPEHKQDFDRSVVQWLRDLVATTNSNINNMKGILKIKDDINQKNKKLYSDKIEAIASTLAPEPKVAKAFTEPAAQQSVDKTTSTSSEIDQPQEVTPQPTKDYKHKTTLDFINKLNQIQ